MANDDDELDLGSLRIVLHGETEQFDKYPALKAKRHAVTVAKHLQASEGLIFLRGNKIEAYPDSDQPRPFRQDRYFSYLSGVNEQGCQLSYDIQRQTLTLYIPKPSVQYALWNGEQLSKSHAMSRYDIDNVRFNQDAHADLNEWVRKNGRASVYLLHQGAFLVRKLKLDLRESQLNSDDLQPAMNKARVRKCPHEIKLIRRANDVTASAHRAVLRSILKLKNEAEIEALFLQACISQGAKNQAYEIIAASGTNASTLHYVKNDEPLKGRQLVCLDAGCEWDCYASDVTRTFPISGSWSPEAKLVHGMVQKIQDACIREIKPGKNYVGIHRLAERMVIEALQALGILKGDTEDIISTGTVKAFFPHGLGHHLGLEVHDVFTPQLLGRTSLSKHDQVTLQPPLPPDHGAGSLDSAEGEEQQNLEEDMVVTIEPGIYFCRPLVAIFLKSPQHRQFIDAKTLERYWAVGGVRIEDNVLVTQDGYEVLSTAPRADEMMELINGQEVDMGVGQ
ncbi:MAG: hypothetical protein M1833_002027 [Piccolia ochrophora]|nr:MAG: hypothetical protein M1833_002027 [Piccolia ochrophora]